MNTLADFCTTQLQQLALHDRLRQRVVRSRAIDPSHDFSSNDYLGLAQHHTAVAAAQQAHQQFGFGSCASPLIAGYTAEHAALEHEFAEFLGWPSCLYVSSGYAANLGLISALLQPQDAIYADKFIHASLIDGARLAGSQLRRYPHQDLATLATWLSRGAAQQRAIISDTVFSMDGDIADVPHLLALSRQHQAWLLLDDAHGFGVLGEHGVGSVKHFALDAGDSLIVTHPLGKALGCAGAIIAASKAVIEFLVNTARSYIYSTSPPASLAAVARNNLRALREESWRHEKLMRNISYFQSRCRTYELPIIPQPTAIQTLMVKDSQRLLHLRDTLSRAGFAVAGIRPPTVPPGTARLRITLTALHEPPHIDALLKTIKAALQCTTNA